MLGLLFSADHISGFIKIEKLDLLENRLLGLDGEGEGENETKDEEPYSKR